MAIRVSTAMFLLLCGYSGGSRVRRLAEPTFGVPVESPPDEDREDDTPPDEPPADDEESS